MSSMSWNNTANEEVDLQPINGTHLNDMSRYMKSNQSLDGRQRIDTNESNVYRNLNQNYYHIEEFYDREPGSIIEPFISVTRVKMAHDQHDINENSSNSIEGRLGYLNFENQDLNGEGIKSNQQRLNEAINRNLNLQPLRSSRGWYNIERSKNSYEEEYKANINNSVPILSYKHQNIANITVDKSDAPSWATGIQQTSVFDSRNGDASSHGYESIPESTLCKIMKRLDQLENRINTTNDKIRISEEISDLKYGEKKIAQDLEREQYLEIRQRCEIIESNMSKFISNVKRDVGSFMETITNEITIIREDMKKNEAKINKLSQKLIKKVMNKIDSKVTQTNHDEEKIKQIDMKMVDMCETMEGMVWIFKENTVQIRAQLEQKIESVSQDLEIFETQINRTNSEMAAQLQNLQSSNLKIIDGLKNFHSQQIQKFNSLSEWEEVDELENEESEDEQENIIPNKDTEHNLQSKALVQLLKAQNAKMKSGKVKPNKITVQKISQK